MFRQRLLPPAGGRKWTKRFGPEVNFERFVKKMVMNYQKKINKWIRASAPNPDSSSLFGPPPPHSPPSAGPGLPEH